MVPDADKKGLPRVVESLFVSSKTKQNIRVLCNLLYRTAYDIRTANSKERLLDQKIPASYLALEKVIFMYFNMMPTFFSLFLPSLGNWLLST